MSTWPCCPGWDDKRAALLPSASSTSRRPLAPFGEIRVAQDGEQPRRRLVPSWNLSRWSQALSSVSCTRSSARSMSPQSDTANARRLRITPSRASRRARRHFASQLFVSASLESFKRRASDRGPVRARHHRKPHGRWRPIWACRLGTSRIELGPEFRRDASIGGVPLSVGDSSSLLRLAFCAGGPSCSHLTTIHPLSALLGYLKIADFLGPRACKNA